MLDLTHLTVFHNSLKIGKLFKGNPNLVMINKIMSTKNHTLSKNKNKKSQSLIR